MWANLYLSGSSGLFFVGEVLRIYNQNLYLILKSYQSQMLLISFTLYSGTFTCQSPSCLHLTAAFSGLSVLLCHLLRDSLEVRLPILRVPL